MSTDNSDSAPAAAPSGEQVTLESVRARIDAIDGDLQRLLQPMQVLSQNSIT